MTEIKPQFLDQLTYSGKFDRQPFRDILTEGIVGTNDLKVEQLTTPAMGVKAASGAGYVQGDQATTQGHYRIYNDASKNLSIAASDPTNPRKDRIIAQVYDSIDIGGIDDEWVLEVLTGTPAASPVAPALPDDALDLAIVLVGNGVETIVNANITDQRTQIALQNVGGEVSVEDVVNNVKARAYLGTDQLNLVNDTWTKILLDTEDYDVGANFASYKFVAPVTGYYLIIGSVYFSSVVTDKVYSLAIYKNNTAISYGNSLPALAATCFVKAQDIVNLTINDYIELFAKSSSGGNTVDIASGLIFTHLAIHLLSV